MTLLLRFLRWLERLKEAIDKAKSESGNYLNRLLATKEVMAMRLTSQWAASLLPSRRAACVG
jgi:hypothetical protein